MATSIKDIIIAELDKLPESKLAEVLDYVRGGKPLPPGTPPGDWKQFVGSIPQDDLKFMERIIEEDCRQIDHEAW